MLQTYLITVVLNFTEERFTLIGNNKCKKCHIVHNFQLIPINHISNWEKYLVKNLMLIFVKRTFLKSLLMEHQALSGYFWRTCGKHMSQTYNDNIKSPKLQDILLGILITYAFCRKLQQWASDPQENTAGVT